jgi:hypothetical protein
LGSNHGADMCILRYLLDSKALRSVFATDSDYSGQEELSDYSTRL